MPSSHRAGHDRDITRLRLQNSRIPVYRLPPELLNLTFLYLRDDADYGRQSHAILVATWVSFHWREIALSSSCLWNFIDNKREGVVSLFFTRSREANLSINLWADSPNDFVPLFQALGRVKSLELRCPEVDEEEEEEEGETTHDDTLLRPHWAQPAPRIQTLSIHHFPIPPNPFNGVSPYLRDVELVWCTFDWDAFPFSTITSLKIVCPDDLISPDHFVRILRDMPLLECLELEGVFRGTDAPGLVRHRLTRLKRLDLIILDATELLDFLQRVSIPPTANIGVGPHECDNMVPQLISELRVCQDGASKRLSHFRVDANENMLSLETVAVPEGKRKSGTRFYCGFSQWQNDQTVASALFAYYDFSALTELTLRSNDQILPNDIWTTIFKPLPQLTSLEVSGVFASTFIQYFTPTTSPITDPVKSGVPIEDLIPDEVRQNVIFPSLKKLTIHRVGYFDEDGDEEEMKWPGQWMLFCLAIGVRSLVGSRMEELVIVRYMLSPEQVNQIKGMVGKFEYKKSLFSWLGCDEDGEEGEEESDDSDSE